MNARLSSQSIEHQGIFTEVLLALVENPGQDLDELLKPYGDQASTIRERVQKLQEQGVLHGGRVGAPLSEIQVGDLLFDGRFRVMELIGSGGMGKIFRAVDVEIDREVAIKTLALQCDKDSESPTYLDKLARFLQEVQVTGQLEHPSIVPVHLLGATESGRMFFAMKLVQGQTLGAVIEKLNKRDPLTEGIFSLRRKLGIIIKICDALTFAHSRGIIHRDLKPSNVMVGEFGEVQVMDWGLAKLIRSDLPIDAEGKLPGRSTLALTVAGSVFGTPNYMAPEQAKGDTESVDVQTDVFGLGALIFHLLCGSPPYIGKSTAEILRKAKHAHLDDPKWENARKSVPREVKSIVEKALQAEKKNRYSSVGELQNDMEAYLEGRPGIAWKDDVIQSSIKLVRRHATIAAALIAVLILVSSISVFYMQNRVLQAAENEVMGLFARDRHNRIKSLGDQIHWITLHETGSLIGEKMPEYENVLSSYERAFQKHDFPLDNRQVVVDRLLSFEYMGPGGARNVLDGLYQMALLHFMLDDAYAGEWQQKKLINFPLETDDAKLKNHLETHPHRVDQWLRIRDILLEAEFDSEYKEVWKACIYGMRTKEDAVSPMVIQSMKLGNARPSHLFASEMIYRVHRRHLIYKMWEFFASEMPGEFRPHSELCHYYSLIKDKGDQNREYWQLAVVHGEAAKAIAPEAPWVYFSLSETYRKLGNSRKAVFHARKAAELLPTNFSMWSKLGLALRTSYHQTANPAEIEEAILSFRKARELNPLRLENYQNLARAYREAGQQENSLAISAVSAVVFPNDREVYKLKANTLMLWDRFDLALAAYADGVDKWPDWTLGWEQIGINNAARNYGMAQAEYCLREAISVQSQGYPLIDRNLDKRLASYRRFTLQALGIQEENKYLAAEVARGRSEYLRSYRKFDEFLQEMEEGKRGDASGIEDPWNYYAQAAPLAFQVHHARGYLYLDRTPILFVAGIPAIQEIDGVQLRPPVALEDRPRLRNSEFDTPKLRQEALQQAHIWLTRAITGTLEDLEKRKPVWPVEEHRETARRLLQGLRPFNCLQEPFESEKFSSYEEALLHIVSRP